VASDVLGLGNFDGSKDDMLGSALGDDTVRVGVWLTATLGLLRDGAWVLADGCVAIGRLEVGIGIFGLFGTIGIFGICASAGEPWPTLLSGQVTVTIVAPARANSPAAATTPPILFFL